MQKRDSINVQEIDLVCQVVSDIELLNMVQFTLDHPSGIVLDMNIINTRYRQLLSENGMNEDDIKANYKPYLKELITDNVTNAKFC